MGDILPFPGVPRHVPSRRMTVRFFRPALAAKSATQMSLRLPTEEPLERRIAAAKDASATRWELAAKAETARLREGWERLAHKADERVAKLLAEKAALTTQPELPECGCPHSQPEQAR